MPLFNAKGMASNLWNTAKWAGSRYSKGATSLLRQYPRMALAGSITGLGAAGIGTAAGAMRDNRNTAQSFGGSIFGQAKYSVAGGIVGAGVGAGVGSFYRFGRNKATVAGSMVGLVGFGAFGAIKGGLGSNKPVNRIRGLHY